MPLLVSILGVVKVGKGVVHFSGRIAIIFGEANVYRLSQIGMQLVEAESFQVQQQAESLSDPMIYTALLDSGPN